MMQVNVDYFFCQSGFSSLFSLPCTLWLMSNSPHPEDPADGPLRQLLCGIHVVSRYTKAYFFNQLFFYSSIWRTFLILYAEGFIRHGKLNLTLFVQLYWVISISFLTVMFGIFPVSLILRGENFLKVKLRKRQNADTFHIMSFPPRPGPLAICVSSCH